MPGLSVGMKCLKCSVFILNLLCLLCSLVLIGFGSYILTRFSEYSASIQKSWMSAPIAIIVLGCIILLISFLGCCGAIKENYCMLYTYGVLLIILLIAEIVAASLAIVYKDQIEGELGKILEKAVKDYANPDVAKTVDIIQETFKCCGSKDSTDYTVTPIPCKPEYFNKGCAKEVIPFVKEKLVIVAAIIFVVICFELLGIIFAFVAARYLREYESV